MKQTKRTHLAHGIPHRHTKTYCGMGKETVPFEEWLTLPPVEQCGPCGRRFRAQDGDYYAAQLVVTDIIAAFAGQDKTYKLPDADRRQKAADLIYRHVRERG